MDLIELGYWGILLAAFLAGTVFPLASEPVLAGLLAAGADPFLALAFATFGNWVGGATTFYIGHLGNWHWIEKYFKAKHETVISYQAKVAKYGGYLAILGWLPFVGNAILLALGFFRANKWSVACWMLVGKLGRYLVVYQTMSYWLAE